MKARDDGAETPSSQRLRKEREAAVEVVEREPLIKQLLEALAAAPSTPTELARRVGARKESVSRKLRVLRDDELVTAARNSGDKRQVRYSLTPQGEAELSRLRAFGVPEQAPPPPDHAEVVQFLRSALRSAIDMRRRTNRLSDAVERLEVVFEQAEQYRAPEVSLEALTELATTLRQDRRTEELQHALDRLEAIALGTDGVKAELVLPAAAHLEYALGRLGDLGKEDVRGRANHMTAAISLYGQLAHSAEAGEEDAWLERRAWSVISLAGNLRKQSRFEDSLSYAAAAKRMFDDLDDPYGRSYCLFMFGFCLRLLGDFDEAWACLDEAYRLADANAFERARADSLMQMGEVRRCQGDVEEARMLLNDALGQADRLKLLVTKAFAQSAMGAVEYQEERFADAYASLALAQKMFTRCKHVEGVALNARRQATVARRLAGMKAGQSQRSVADLIAFAYKRYANLNSPAGIAACEVEQGRLQMIRRRGRVGEVIEKLKSLLHTNRQREILELDPWVPHVLDDFAREADDETLAAQTSKVLETAGERLADRAAQGVERLTGVVDWGRLEEDGEANALAAEMGGEARRVPGALALS